MNRMTIQPHEFLIMIFRDVKSRKIAATTIFTWRRTLNVASGAQESHVGPPKDMLTCCLFELEVNIISYYHHDAGYHSHHHEHHHKPAFQVPA